jgi:putative membrane protein
MRSTGTFIIACAAAFTVACNNSRTADEQSSTAPYEADGGTIGTAGSGDRDNGAMADAQQFMREAAMHGQAEVRLGEFAARKTQNADVRQFAQMMVTDHTKANNELKSVADRHNIQLPTEIDQEHMDMLIKWEKMSSAEFDRDYMEAMVEGHEEVRDMLAQRGRTSTVGTSGSATSGASGSTGAGSTTATGDGNGSTVEDAVSLWAARTLPTVEQHLEQARRLNDQVKR